MKNKIFKILTYVASVLVGIAIGFMLNKSISKTNSSTLNKTNVTLAIDSVNTSNANEKIKSIDSSIVKSSAKINDLKVLDSIYVIKYKTIRDTIYGKYVECDSALIAADSSISIQGKQIAELNNSNSLYANKCIVLNDLTSKKDSTILKLNNNLNELNKLYKTRINWWNRNKFTVGLLTGIASVATTAILVK